MAVLGLYIVWFAPLPFVQGWWLRGDGNRADHFRLRHRIGDWLVMSGQLEGRTRAEIVAMLGPPTPTDHFADRDMVYALGIERGFLAIDSEWLILDFSEQGICMAAEIVTD